MYVPPTLNTSLFALVARLLKPYFLQPNERMVPNHGAPNFIMLAAAPPLTRPISKLTPAPSQITAPPVAAPCGIILTLMTPLLLLQSLSWLDVMFSPLVSTRTVEDSKDVGGRDSDIVQSDHLASTGVRKNRELDETDRKIGSRQAT